MKGSIVQVKGRTDKKVGGTKKIEGSSKKTEERHGKVQGCVQKGDGGEMESLGNLWEGRDKYAEMKARGQTVQLLARA